MRIHNRFVGVVSLLLLASVAHAQIVPAQNQQTTGPFGGIVLSTSSSPTAKLNQILGSAFGDLLYWTGGRWNTIATSSLGLTVNGITALTGDVTATGPGSVPATLATVNGNVGSFTNSSITVNAKGLITAAASGAMPEVPLTFLYPLVRTINAISLAFGTTTSNTWAGTQTFTNSPVFSTLGAGTVNATAAGTVYNTGTSTPTVTAPITYSGTLGQFIGGISGTFDCIAATGSVKGCLIASDWTSFNNKVSSTSLSASAPIRYVPTTGVFSWFGLATTSQPASSNLLISDGLAGVYGTATTSVTCSGSTSCTPFTVIGAAPVTISSSGGGGSGTVSTSTNETAGQVPYWTTTSGTPALLGSIATSTVTFTGPFTGYSTLGTLVGGSNSTVNWTGLATTSQPSSSNLLVSNGGAGVYAVATSSATCSGSVSCSPFTVVGSVSPTITSTALTAAITSIGPVGQTSTGPVITLATSTSATNGLTSALTIVGSGATMTFTPSLSGTLTVPGGGTGVSSWTSSAIPYGNGTANVSFVATSSETCTSPLSCTAHDVLTGGGAITLGTVPVAKGGTGTTTAPVSQLIYGGSGSVYQSVATSTLAVGNGITTTSGSLGFQVGGTSASLGLAAIAANSLLGNVTGSAAVPVAVATTSLFSGTTGQFPYFSGTNTLTATSTLFLSTSANIGIGSSTPYADLSLDAPAGTAAYFAIGSTSQEVFKIAPSATALLGVGTTSPWRTLSVTGTVGFDGLTASASVQSGILCLSANKEVINDSVACVASSRRFKDDIAPLSETSGLAELMQLQPVSFKYKPEYNGALQSNPNYNGQMVGFIAEDVQKIDPRLVVLETEDSKPGDPIVSKKGEVHSVRYEQITAIIVKAVQEIAQKDTTQDSEIASLKAEIAALKNGHQENTCHL